MSVRKITFAGILLMIGGLFVQVAPFQAGAVSYSTNGAAAATLHVQSQSAGSSLLQTRTVDTVATIRTIEGPVSGPMFYALTGIGLAGLIGMAIHRKRQAA
jgi:hypothetical protein